MQQYGINTLMDEEVISVFTDIPVAQIKMCIDDYGLPEIIKYTQLMGYKNSKRKA